MNRHSFQLKVENLAPESNQHNSHNFCIRVMKIALNIPHSIVYKR